MSFFIRLVIIQVFINKLVVNKNFFEPYSITEKNFYQLLPLFFCYIVIMETITKKPRKKYHKLTKQEQKEIITQVKLDNSKTNVARISKEYDITERQIYKLRKSDVAKDIEQSIMKHEEEFTKRVEELIKLTMDRIEKELQEGEKITLSQLSTTLGILYDKSRLEKNLSTSNNSINIHIKVEK